MTHRTGAELIDEAKSRIREVTPDEAMRQAESNSSTVFLDCREANEWNLAHIPGAVFIPRGSLETKVEAIIPRDSKVIIYCASGNRSAFAAETLGQMGYGDVASMKGGIRAWVDAGGEVE